jgi:hypothetical protein
MTQAATLVSRLPALLSRTRFYYGWVVVGLAALALMLVHFSNPEIPGPVGG